MSLFSLAQNPIKEVCCFFLLESKCPCCSETLLVSNFGARGLSFMGTLQDIKPVPLFNPGRINLFKICH